MTPPPSSPSASTTKAGQPPGRRVALWLAYGAMCLIWGSTWTAIKVGLRGAPPMTSLGMRFLLAGAIVALVLRLRGTSLPRTRHFWSLGIFLGFTHMAFPYVLVYWAEQYVASGLPAVLYSTMPLMVAVMARAVLGDPLPPRKVAGIAGGIAGVALIFTDSLRGGGGAERAALGVGAVLLSVFFASISSVVVKRHGKHYDPLAALVVPFSVGGLVVMAAAAAFEQVNPLRFDLPTWGTIVYLAVAGSVVAFTLFFWIVKHLDVTVVAYQTFIIPVLAVLLGWVLLDEALTPRVGVGAGIILASLALATWRLPRARRRPPVPRTPVGGCA